MAKTAWLDAATAHERLRLKHSHLRKAERKLVAELDAYRAAVSIAKAEREAAISPEPRKTNLGRFGKTAVDSWREIFPGLPAHVKAVLKLLSEAFEIFAHD